MDPLVSAALRTASSIVPNTPVLHIDSGRDLLGVLLNQLSLDCRSACVDGERSAIVQQALEAAGFAGDRASTMDDQRLPFESQAFDWVFTIVGPEEGSRMENLGAETLRVMRTGGWLWLASPVDHPVIRDDGILIALGFVSASGTEKIDSTGYASRILRKVDAATPV